METTKSLAVIGLGYIGLPTAVVLAENGWSVTGVDINPRTVTIINEGHSPISEAELAARLQRVVAEGRFHATTDTPAAAVYIISVPTPCTENHDADLSFICEACEAIAPMLSGDELVILESTSPVGTTRRVAQWILERRPDLSLDGTGGRPLVHFAHAPERVLPGRIMAELIGNDRIVGGITSAATVRAKDVYSSFCEGKILETNAETAELSKLAENSYRDVNIALANELSLICDRHGINVWELIALANRHPRVEILNPGPGVGGHCIAVDPWFVVAGAPEQSRLIRTAREVNDLKPTWVLERFTSTTSRLDAGRKIAILGLTFKPNVDDLRESPALAIARNLVSSRPDIEFLLVEPNICDIPADFAGSLNVTHTDDVHDISVADAVLVLVGHRQFRHARKYLRNGIPYLDTVGIWN